MGYMSYIAYMGCMVYMEPFGTPGITLGAPGVIFGTPGVICGAAGVLWEAFWDQCKVLPSSKRLKVTRMSSRSGQNERHSSHSVIL